MPFAFVVYSGQFDSAFDAVAHKVFNLIKRPLNSVIYRLYKARCQLYGKRLTGGINRFTGSEAGSLFINLDRCSVASHLYDLADESFFTHPHYFIHLCIAQSFCYNQRT